MAWHYLASGLFNTPMLETLIKRAIFLCVLFVISSCLSYTDVEIVEFTDIKLKELSSKGMVIDIDLQVRNPNNYKISVVKTDINVSLNNRDMGKAEIQGNLVLPKNSDEIHRITAKLNGKQIGGAMSLLLSTALGNPMTIGIKGSITAKAKLLRKKIDVEFTERISK